MSGLRALLVAGLMVGVAACVPKGRYQAAVGEAEANAGEVARLRAELSATQRESERLANELAATEGALEATNRKLASKIAEAGALQDDLGRLHAALTEAEHRRQRGDLALADLRTLEVAAGSALAPFGASATVVEGQPAISLPADRVFTGATAALSKEGEATLRAAATVLGAFPERRLLVLVHTDDSFLPGDRFPSAWHLGASRAAAVGVALVAAGVPAPSLTVATRGAQSPASEAALQQARGASRRVEIVLQADPRDFPGWAPLNAQASGARAP